MRVISGKYKGLNLKGFDIDGTRPTMDRVKESLFGMIQNNLKDSICLDLFAGSGSLGLEALSNGANKCYFVDNNNIAIKIMHENFSDLKEEHYIIKSDFKQALNKFKDVKFDLIFLDPPYKLNLINDCLSLIKEHDLLNDNGLIVCEYETEQINNIFQLYKEKRYGSTYIKIFKK